MHKIVISGGPHAGKTTLWHALKGEYPRATFVPEPATSLMTRERRERAEDPSHRPLDPKRNFSAFAPAVLRESIVLESQISTDADLVFQDRSLVDAIGYFRLNNVETLMSEVERHIAKASYSLVFFCELIDGFTPGGIRSEKSFDECSIVHERLREAYIESGLPIVYLPAVPVEDRVSMVMRSLLTVLRVGEVNSVKNIHDNGSC